MMSLFARCSQGLPLRLSAFLCSAGAKWASPSTLTDRARSYSVASTLVMQITEGVLNAKPDDDLLAAADRLPSH